MFAKLLMYTSLHMVQTSQNNKGGHHNFLVICCLLFVSSVAENWPYRTH